MQKWNILWAFRQVCSRDMSTVGGQTLKNNNLLEKWTLAQRIYNCNNIASQLYLYSVLLLLSLLLLLLLLVVVVVVQYLNLGWRFVANKIFFTHPPTVGFTEDRSNSFGAKFRLRLSFLLYFFYFFFFFLLQTNLERSLYVKLNNWISKSVDSDETSHDEPSHLDLRCLQKPIMIAYGHERAKAENLVLCILCPSLLLLAAIFVLCLILFVVLLLCLFDCVLYCDHNFG